MAMTNAINQGYASLGQTKVDAPRTLSSAAGRLETLNERLSQASEALSTVCAQIGAMSPLGQVAVSSGNEAVPGGAVHRLNDLAEDANAKLSNIETFIASIQRALG